jgi:pimeloyl-ACP methyl ester carboxylesterase
MACALKVNKKNKGYTMDNHPLLLLHGALGASTQYAPLLPLIEDRIDVHTPDFEGHHTSPLRDRPFRFNHFAENVLDYMDGRTMDKVHIFGHSLGGAVGLYLARSFPERVAGVFTLGIKFEWSPEIARAENAFLDPQKMKQKVPGFAKMLHQRHTAAGWETLLKRVRDLHLSMGRDNPLKEADYRSINQKVRIAVGDRDKMVDIEQSVKVYRLLQHGEFQVFPATPHPLEQVDMPRLASAILDFFG